MKKLITAVATLFVAPLLMATSADARQPLRGEMELNFNVGFVIQQGCTQVTWAGTVAIDGETYGMAFFPTGSRQTGEAFHFDENWVVYEEPFGFDEPGLLTECPEGDIVLSGYDSGVTSPNAKYRMSGAVEVAASGFDDWDGRRVHMDGEITYDETTGVPLTAPGSFRLN